MGLEPSIELDARDVSGMFLDFLGLWDGMDSGIGAICSGTLGMCPWASRDSGMGWTVGLEHSAVGHSGHVWDVPGMGWTLGLEPSRVGCSGHVWDIPGLPRTLGWHGQWD